MTEKNFITRDEILKHRTVDSMWLVIDSKVYVQVSTSNNGTDTADSYLALILKMFIKLTFRLKIRFFGKID